MGVNLLALKLAVLGIDLREATFSSLPYLGIILLCMVFTRAVPQPGALASQRYGWEVIYTWLLKNEEAEER